MSPRGTAQEAPDSHLPLLGWRVWRLGDDGLLRPISIFGTAPWSPGANEARCRLPRKRRHRAPHPGCQCGFNALHHPPDEYRGRAEYAIGVIAAWGEVDVYRAGFRAQFASVLGLLLDEGLEAPHEQRLQGAASRYGVALLPLGELGEHAARHARPAGATLTPGIDLSPPAGRPTQPLPLTALPSGFEGRGVQIHAHLAVDHRRRYMRLGPTPSLAALASDRVEPTVVPGDVVGIGEPIFVARAGASVVPAPAPASGTVIAVNDGVPRYEEGPAGEGWLVELRLEAESLDGTSIAWGRQAAEAYRDFVLAARSDADLLMSCAENPSPADGLCDADEGRAWLRAFAQQLDAALRADEALCAALRSLALPVEFEVEGVEALRVAAPPVGSSRWVRTEPIGAGGRPPGAGESGAEGPVGSGEGRSEGLRIELGPAALRGYWCGELGLAPDHVSVAAAGAGEGQGARNPLHLRCGDRGRLLLANSLHKRLFEPAAAILAGLGDPWFKAGDAVRDPVRNLEALAGFERPDALGGAA